MSTGVFERSYRGVSFTRGAGTERSTRGVSFTLGVGVDRSIRDSDRDSDRLSDLSSDIRDGEGLELLSYRSRCARASPAPINNNAASTPTAATGEFTYIRALYSVFIFVASVPAPDSDRVIGSFISRRSGARRPTSQTPQHVFRGSRSP